MWIFKEEVIINLNIKTGLLPNSNSLYGDSTHLVIEVMNSDGFSLMFPGSIWERA
jgi:hypothetical protein